MKRLLVLDIGDCFSDIDPLRVENAAGVVRDRDDLRPVAREGEGGLAPHVAEALDRDRGLGDGNLQVLEVFFNQVSHAGAGRLAPALGAAEGDGLARDDGGLVVADVIGIGVHHPAHDFFVGADVGRGHVDVRPEEVHHLLHIAPGQALEFGF